MGWEGNVKDRLTEAKQRMNSFPSDTLGWYMAALDAEEVAQEIWQSDYFTDSELKKLGLLDEPFKSTQSDIWIELPEYDDNQVLIKTKPATQFTVDPTAQIYQGGCI